MRRVARARSRAGAGAPARHVPPAAREPREDPEALSAEVQATLFDTLDDETWERLEEALIMADVGARTTAEVVERLEHEATSGERRGRRGAAPARLVELLADEAAGAGDGRRSTCARSRP